MDDRTIAHYRLVEELGRGGMGIVYRAEDTRLGRMVAMKFMADHLVRDRSAADRFLQEARAAAALSHPNIATLYGIEEADGRRFITMEYVEGESLDDLIAQGVMAADRALDLAIQTARGLERAHETGIIHRDIKPANIRVTPRGELKILDFGLAKLQGSADMSQVGTTVGTAAYMSPQQVLGEDVDATTDLWALGVVLYEMLTGRRPFSHQYVQALYYEILNQTPAAVSSLRSDLDPALDGVIERLLAKEPRHRYPSAGELIDDLVRIRTGVMQTEADGRSSAVRPAVHTQTTPSATSRSEERERRQLTTLYCELVGHGEMASEMDPEDLGETTAWLAGLCEEQIARFGGHAVRPAGGGLLGYFGYPAAHEHDARHAVQSGLAILSRAAETPLPGRAGAMDVRIGVQTGLNIVRLKGAGIEVQGGGTGVAARLADCASPGQILVDRVTQRLVRGHFDMASQGLQEIRGFSEPQPVFSVVSERAGTPPEQAGAAAEPPLVVGRDLELDLLRRQWRTASTGSGRAVLITGEPGIGKSHLVDALLREAHAGPATWSVRLTCSPLETGTAFGPLAVHILAALRAGTSDPDISDVSSWTRASGIASPEDIALLAEHLGLAVPADWPRSSASPAARRQRLLQILVQAIAMREPDRPGVILVDDLHWSDPSTAEWLDLLVAELPSLRLLVLVLTRPPSLPAWLSRTHATEIALGKLTAEDLASITRQRAGSKALPPEIIRHVADRTDGVPLFAEELTNMIIESGLLRDAGDRYELTGPLPEHLIPTTLQGSLMARLDQQASARQVAQTGAVIGRHFAFRLLQAVSDDGDQDAHREALERLSQAELLTRRGFIPDATFEFRHALIRDAAYESLLRNRRREIHERVADVLSQGPYDASPAVVAQHYADAGLPARALPHRIEAGRSAMRANANREAVEQLRAALDLVRELDEGPDRDGREIEVLTLLGPAVMMTKGYADPEGEEIFLRVQDLCRRLDATQPLFFSLYGLVSVYLIRGEYSRSFDILERSLATAGELGEPRWLLLSHNATGVARMFAGRPADAIGHLDRVLALHDAERDGDLGLLGWGGLDVSASTSRQLALQLLGRSSEALAQCTRSMTMAEGSPNHMTVYHAHLYAGLLYLMRREWSACREVMEVYLPMAIAYGDPFYVAISTVVHGLAHREPGQADGLRQAGAVLEQMRAGGFALGVGFLLTQLADGHLAHGDPDAAGTAIDGAVRHLEGRGGEFWEADAYRVKGEIEALRGGDPLPWLERALAVAREQGARWLELRAATALARRLTASGDMERSRALLADALACIEDGDGLPDAIETRALVSDPGAARSQA